MLPLYPDISPKLLVYFHIGSGDYRTIVTDLAFLGWQAYCGATLNKTFKYHNDKATFIARSSPGGHSRCHLSLKARDVLWKTPNESAHRPASVGVLILVALKETTGSISGTTSLLKALPLCWPDRIVDVHGRPCVYSRLPPVWQKAFPELLPLGDY